MSSFYYSTLADFPDGASARHVVVVLLVWVCIVVAYEEQNGVKG